MVDLTSINMVGILHFSITNLQLAKTRGT